MEVYFQLVNDAGSLKKACDELKNDPFLKFDVKWVRHHLGCEVGSIYDTYLASLLVAAGEGERRHGLADVVQFFLQRTLDKTEQVSDWGANELSPSQIEYAARDAAIMPEV